MKIFEKELKVATSKRVEFIDVTAEINKIVDESKISNGVCYIFVPHTTAAITINENADPDVITDIINTINSIVPHKGNYFHLEGNSDAHIKSSLFGATLSVFVNNKKLKLGTWQGIYFCEFDGPRHRKVWIKVIGE
mgnify:CR=1 FL=1